MTTNKNPRATFIFSRDPSVWAEVEVKIASQNIGAFQAQFRVLRHSEIKNLPKESDAFCLQLLTESLQGWKNMKTEEGGEMIFSSENLEKVLDVPPLRLALMAAYNTSVLGYREKN